jgi:hypothetical protein
MKTRLLQQQLINNEGTDPITTTTKPPLRNHTEVIGKHQLLHRLLPHVNTGKDINENTAGILSQLLLRISQLPHTGKICFKTKNKEVSESGEVHTRFPPSFHDTTSRHWVICSRSFETTIY